MVPKSNRKIGFGVKVIFWEDIWIHNNNLKFVYTRLYSISLDHRLKVGEVGL